MKFRFIAVVGLLCHCAATPRSATPRGSLTAFAVAATAGDADTLYALLPESARRAESQPTFRARLLSDGAELRELGQRVAASLARERLPAAIVPLSSGDAAYLQESPSGFGLSHPGFGATAAPTPVDSLRSFRAALTRGEFSALRSVLSASAAGSLDAQVRSLIDALRDPASLQITSTSTQYSARLPDGRTIILVREGDQWRVDDIHDGAQ